MFKKTTKNESESAKGSRSNKKEVHGMVYDSKNKKLFGFSFNVLLVLVLFLIVFGLVGLSYYLIKNLEKKETVVKPAQVSGDSRAIPAGTKTQEIEVTLPNGTKAKTNIPASALK